MGLCDRYLLREFAQAFLVGLLTAVLLVVALRFQQAVIQLAQQHAPPSLLLQQIAWDLPNVLELALPVATALGAALATNRLARDNELTVLRGTGTSLVRLFAPFVFLGMLLAVAGIYNANALQPIATERRRSISGFLRNPVGTSEPGQATRGGAQGEWLIQFERGDRKSETLWQLYTVSLIQKERILLAPTATYDSVTGLWTLERVVEHLYGRQGKLTQQRKHPTLTLSARTEFSGTLPFWEAQQSFQTPLSFATLTEAARKEKNRGNQKKALELETARWFKLALSSMCAVFALCAPPIALKFSKAGSFAGVLLSVIIVFVGWNTVLLMKSVALSGWVPPVVCAFSTHTLFILAGIVLLLRAD